MPDVPFFTVGHSTKTVDEFVELLDAGAVVHVVDVRKMPRSRTNPQFNADALSDELTTRGRRYTHIPALAGLRPRSESVPPDVNGFWTNQSFHNYADYALSEEFAQGLAQLQAIGREERCAVMCAEAVWWRCHRRIIADHLIHRGETVYHLLGTDRVERATLTRGATEDDIGRLVYPVDGRS